MVKLRYLRHILILWAALAVLSISGAWADDTPTLDGHTPAIGSSTQAIKKDGDLELAELYKRACVPVTFTGGTTAFTATSPSVAKTALTDGMCMRGQLNASLSAAGTIALDGLTAKSIRKQDGTAAGSGDANAGIIMEFDYVAADNSGAGGWRIQDPVATGGGGGTPGGSSGQTQYNSAGAFGGYTPSGDVTVVPSTGVETIAAGAVSLAKMANLAANSILGNNTGSPATPIALTAAQIKTLIAISLSTDVTGTLQSGQMPTFTGDVTNVGLAMTVANNAVTNAKAAQMGANSVKCNNTGSTANAIDCTASQALALVGAEGTFTASTALSAAGSTQGTATALTKTSDLQLYEVTTVAASAGVVMPTSTVPQRAVIVNKGANALSIYPASTGTIDGGSASAPVTLGVGQAMLFTAKDASNNWYTLRGATYSATAPPAPGTASAGTSSDFMRSNAVIPAADLSTTTQVTGVLAASHMPALTGDVTTSSGGVATTIANSAVSLAKMANETANTILGNNTGSPAAPIALTAAQVKTLLAIVRADITDLGTNVGTALGNTLNGASGLVSKDANSNVSANNFLAGSASTVTAAGTTTLVVGSAEYQFFTGTTTQTITAPVVSGLVLGQRYWIINQSSGSLTLNSSGGNLIQTITAGNTSIITVVSTSGTTAASWSNIYVSSGAGTGTVTSITCGNGLSGGTITTAGTCDITAPISAANGGTGVVSPTAHNLIVGNGASAMNTLAPGSSGNVATSNGTDWTSAAPPASGMTLLSTLTTTSGTTASYTGIPSTYRELYIEVDGVSFTGTVTLAVAVSGNTGTNYGTSVNITASGASAVSQYGTYRLSGLRFANQFGAMIVGNSTPNGSATITQTAAAIGKNATGATNPIDAIQFSGGTFDAGTIRIYGVQ